MGESQHAGTKAGWLTAAASHVGGRKLARWSGRAHQDERHAKAVRTGVVLTLFLALLTAALLVGGRAAIDPLLRAAADGRDAQRTGDIIYTMPDGSFCRHLAFDNTTGEVTERTIEQCAHDISRARGRDKMGFTWGAR